MEILFPAIPHLRVLHVLFKCYDREIAGYGSRSIFVKNYCENFCKIHETKNTSSEVLLYRRDSPKTKKAHHNRYFPVNFTNFLGTATLQSSCEWPLLNNKRQIWPFSKHLWWSSFLLVNGKKPLIICAKYLHHRCLLRIS